ncbi:hypothetical protein [Kosakonia cowanii]|uniref:Uncharacterized protein n=1 Tax=Kosakonia cowanii JCM 10956 = DSM 18146 TaxID=1300165 RepID=A0A807LE25_9ENTR|nr:hypothetical protein [Kosakonia cowanii]APZ06044.1 hypothetical protein BWI95_13800 [Kosakonia cowanii JCM 10956 = DSM 18146]MDM9614805.1 hypothetical protein [Kosakonia cowanii]MDP4559630.1 hypothetical protein [Kosakonia cowanii]
MIRPGKRYRLRSVIIGLTLVVNGAFAAPASEVEKIIAQGFPAQQHALIETTSALWNEYRREHHVASLIFYAYGLLQQAKHYVAINDFIHAAEYAKTGFFYLDEAVESNDDNLRLHYLRARIDAYLPAKSGRCIIALHDTERLINATGLFDANMLIPIRYMRYRALIDCGLSHDAGQLLNELRQTGTRAEKYTLLPPGTAPEWDLQEITQIVMPLLNEK